MMNMFTLKYLNNSYLKVLYRIPKKIFGNNYPAEDAR